MIQKKLLGNKGGLFGGHSIEVEPVWVDEKRGGESRGRHSRQMVGQGPQSSKQKRAPNRPDVEKTFKTKTEKVTERNHHQKRGGVGVRKKNKGENSIYEDLWGESQPSWGNTGKSHYVQGKSFQKVF